MSTAALSRRVNLVEWSNTFVPFGVLLTAALVGPELTADVMRYRIIVTIWVSTVLLIPAMCFAALSRGLPGRRNHARLFWTFSYLAYMAHFYYAVFVHFGGVAETFANFNPVFAAINFFLTAWWTVDVLLVWTVPPDRAWLRLERLAVHLFLYVIFVGTNVVLMSGVVRVLGLLLAVSVPLCLLVRWACPPRPQTAES